ncbi:M1 family metallopeptidase [Actinocorallia longicatena]|uniref:Aminopeptidase N n=1 Tax=Actinocorallia longicatena TaxID=111803 RepID=A0ABP6Q297_9ACTN
MGVACQAGDPKPAPPVQPQATSGAPATPSPSPSISDQPIAATQSSAGDPYVPGDGNGGYDVLHYDLKLKIIPADEAKTLDGVVTIRAKATTDLLRFNLDLTGLRVSAVQVDGKKAKFTRDGSELVITPPASLPAGGQFTVAVAYAGTPKAIVDPILGRYGWIKTPDGITAACQPSGAHTWFPSNDHPSDKATFDITLTVPQDLSALSNGEAGPSVTAGGLTTTRWRMKQPMATYLAMVTVGKFKVKQGVTPGGIPITTAVDTTIASPSIEEFHEAKAKITDEWVKLFGPYPFDSTGGVIDNADVGFALETQSRTIYGQFDPGEEIIAHELAHQWFGDSVSVTQWRDIWLNEGFATFAEWTWAERRGRGTVKQQFDSLYAQADSPNWRTLPGDPGRSKLFDTFAVYNRGAMALYALEQKIGRTEFYDLLRTWAREHRYANATTADFVALASKVAGTDLDPFFRAWLYGNTRPEL